jgi:hypothetical protein
MGSLLTLLFLLLKQIAEDNPEHFKEVVSIELEENFVSGNPQEALTTYRDRLRLPVGIHA